MLLMFLASHPTCPPVPVGANFDPADAIFAFGRADPAVAAMAATLYDYGLSKIVMFTGGIGRDSGPIMTEYKVPEAVFQAILANQYDVPESDIVIEPIAKNGGDNCRFGYNAVEKRLKRAPHSLVFVAFPLSLRRLVEQFLTIAAQKKWPDIIIQSCPTDCDLDLIDPPVRAAMAGEVRRLLMWPHEYAKGLPLLRPQPELTKELIDIGQRLEKEALSA
jgi:hypothetical protein